VVALEQVLPAAVAALAGAAERVEVLRVPERAALERLERRAGELAAAMTAGSEREQVLQRDARAVSGRVTTLEVEAAHAEERLGEVVRRRAEIAERAGIAPVDRIDPLPADEEATLAHRIDRLERRREQLGMVNPLAQQEYEEAKGRHEETSEQIADLEGSLRELRRLIRDLTATITERFDETYSEVASNFEQVITTLFPGGRGRLRLVEPELHVAAEGEESEAPEIAVASAEPGVELEVTPAGKQITRLAMLSGGEKALAAIAFLFAIMLARPCPFYVLDEVDAALDDANVERFLTLVDRYRDRAQFIVITHQKRTMEMADVLYGITMAGDGISKVVSRRLPRERREAFQPAPT
jgi:chromosome segregation protein